LKTSSVKKLILILNETSNVAIEGPKGSGKICLCAMVYEMLAAAKEDCIFLTSKSFTFDNIYCKRYFTSFYGNHMDCFNEDPIDFPGCKENYIATLTTLITRVRHQKSLNAFLDQAVIAQGVNDHGVKTMLDIASQHLNQTGCLTLSVSSGVQQLL